MLQAMGNVKRPISHSASHTSSLSSGIPLTTKSESVINAEAIIPAVTLKTVSHRAQLAHRPNQKLRIVRFRKGAQHPVVMLKGHKALFEAPAQYERDDLLFPSRVDLVGTAVIA